MGAKIGRHTVDALFPDADTLAAGYATVRMTWQRIEERPAREAARLKEILRLRT
jgi:hypothetical protein